MSADRDEIAAIDYGDTAPTVEVVVYQHGEIVHRARCESVEAAADVVERWSELEGVECTVDDLGAHHVAGEILEPEPDELVDETYPRGSTGD